MKHFLSLIGGAMLGLVLAQGGPALAVDTTTSVVCTDPTLPLTSRLVAAKEGYPDPGNCYAYPMAGPAAYEAFGPTPAPFVTGRSVATGHEGTAEYRGLTYCSRAPREICSQFRGEATAVWHARCLACGYNAQVFNSR